MSATNVTKRRTFNHYIWFFIILDNFPLKLAVFEHQQVRIILGLELSHRGVRSAAEDFITTMYFLSFLFLYITALSLFARSKTDTSDWYEHVRFVYTNGLVDDDEEDDVVHESVVAFDPGDLVDVPTLWGETNRFDC